MIKANTIQDIIKSDIIYKSIVSIIWIILSYFVIKIINFIITKIENKLKTTKYTSLSALLLTIKKPLQVFIWCTCLYKILTLNNVNLVFIFELRIILISAIAIWFLFDFVKKYTNIYIEEKEQNRESIDYNGIEFIKKLSQIFICLIVSIFALSKLGIDTQSLAVISGAGTLVIGFAAKEMFSNIIGGLILYFDKPFVVGDWIASPDKDIEGDVEEIGWRKTRILTFAKHPIYVPNSIFMDIIIENKTRMKSRRIDEMIPVRYVDVTKMNKIVKDVKDMLQNHININHRLITIVAFDSITPTATLNLKIYTFTNTIEWLRYMEIKQDILIKIIEIIQENGGELAYGVQEIFLRKERQVTKLTMRHSDVF